MNWDYVIVGAGSSGCAVANRLSESGDKRVLLLEAGPRDGSLVLRIPSAFGFFDIKRFDWGYHSAPDISRNGRSEHWIRGRVLGGCSSVNGMNYVRGSSSDFERWVRMGNYGWGPETVMTLFTNMERCDRSSIEDPDHVRGRDGTLHVRMVKDCHPVTEAFLKAAQSAGHRFNHDYNGISQEGVGYTQLTQRGRRRWNAADAFLRPALKRSNLRLVVAAHVHKVLFDGPRASGVLYEQDGVLHEIRARHVILCAGAVNTPKLLMLSGIGDGVALVEHGINVVLDRKSVGQGLLEHPLIRLVYRVSMPTHNLTGGLLQKARQLAQYLFRGQGPIASGFEAMAFLRTSPLEREPDVQLHFLPFGYDVQTDSVNAVVQMLPYPSVTVLLNKCHPTSRGRVRLASSDPNASPVIEPRLLASDKDVETLLRGITMVRCIMASTPMSEIVVGEVRPGDSYRTAESLNDYLVDNTTLAYHPAGTCRMGVDDEAVVTPDLRVRGIENLWIADASVMPDLISGNTNAVCMMIGEKLGRALAAGSARRKTHVDTFVTPNARLVEREIDRSKEPFPETNFSPQGGLQN